MGDWEEIEQFLTEWVESVPIEAVIEANHKIWHAILPYSPIEQAFTGWCDG